MGSVVLLTVALTRLGPAVPTVRSAAVVIDTVKQGDVVREVRGPGTLVPEHIRWITAQASARVNTESGSAVKAGELLLELSNPDLQIQTMQAEQQVQQAQIDLLNLRTNLRSAILRRGGGRRSGRRAPGGPRGVGDRAGRAPDTRPSPIEFPVLQRKPSGRGRNLMLRCRRAAGDIGRLGQCPSYSLILTDATSSFRDARRADCPAGHVCRASGGRPDSGSGRRRSVAGRRGRNQGVSGVSWRHIPRVRDRLLRAGAAVCDVDT